MTENYFKLSDMMNSLLVSKQYDTALQMIGNFKSTNKAEEAQKLGLKAEVYSDAGMQPEAIEAINNAIDLDAANLANHYRRACYFFDIENYCQANLYLDKLLHRSRKAEDSYFFDEATIRKAICLIQFEQKNEAKRLLDDLPGDLSVFIGERELTVLEVLSWC